MCGYLKDLITFAKYLPPVLLNYYKQNTIGYNVWHPITDLLGGILSYAQMTVDALRSGKSSVFEGGMNIAKFGLSVIAIVYNVIFLTQHFCLYRKNNQRIIEEEEKH